MRQLTGAVATLLLVLLAITAVPSAAAQDTDHHDDKKTTDCPDGGYAIVVAPVDEDRVALVCEGDDGEWHGVICETGKKVKKKEECAPSPTPEPTPDPTPEPTPPPPTPPPHVPPMAMITPTPVPPPAEPPPPTTPPPTELAHTGTDEVAFAVAVVLILGGAAFIVTGRRWTR